MKSSTPAGDRRGFTILEMIVSMTIIAITLALTVPFFRIEVQAFGNISGRDDAQQNARYGVSMIDRELRVAGVGVLDPQPLIVQADKYAVTFNADLVSRDKNDLGAAYYDPDVDANASSSLPMTSKVSLPLSSPVVQYPDTNYTLATGGVLSEAETISYWVALDPDPSANGTYALFRRVNALPVTVVAKALVVPTGQPAFRYYKDSVGSLVEIPQASLPLYHTAKIHNSTADTAKSALTDAIRVVRVRITGQFTDRKGVKLLRPVETGIRIMNAGLLHFHTCGDPPIVSSAVVAVATTVPSTKVVVTWNSSVDQAAGEKDVEQYSIYRKVTGATLFGEPLASVPSGTATYSFTDNQVASGDQWVYGIAAVDCGGQSSAVVSAPSVLVP